MAETNAPDVLCCCFDFASLRPQLLITNQHEPTTYPSPLRYSRDTPLGFRVDLKRLHFRALLGKRPRTRFVYDREPATGRSPAVDGQHSPQADIGTNDRPPFPANLGPTAQLPHERSQCAATLSRHLADCGSRIRCRHHQYVTFPVHPFHTLNDATYSRRIPANNATQRIRKLAKNLCSCHPHDFHRVVGQLVGTRRTVPALRA